jgi:phage terminase Nu1 subunit (DNA packaging protein)
MSDAIGPTDDASALAEVARRLVAEAKAEGRNLSYAAAVRQAATTAEAEAGDLRTQEETARFFGVSVPTVKRWIADGCPVVEKGSNGVAYRLSLRAVADWRKAREEAERAAEEAKAAADAQLAMELLGGDAVAEPTAGLSGRQKGELIRAELDAIRLGRERGELVRFEDARSHIARAGHQLTTAVRTLPDALAGEFGWSEEVTAKVVTYVDNVLNDFADALDGLAAALRGDA